MSLNHSWARELVARWGSPLYVYDLDEAAARASELFEALPSGSEIVYSFKANPLPSLAAALRSGGCGAELSSLGELESAIEAGFQPEELMFGGPAKSDEEIGRSMDYGIRRYSCESWVDLGRVDSAARLRNFKVEVLLRVNPNIAPQSGLAMAGVTSQFGFEEEQLVAESHRLSELSELVDVCGFHIYFGTQMKSASAIAEAVEVAITTAERLAAQMSIPVRLLDVGGGFPWPYATAGKHDLTGLKESLAELSARRDRTAGALLIFESGRYLSASSGTLVTTVMDIKESKGKKYVVVDAGINHLGGMSGLGRIPRSHISIGSELDTESVTEAVDIVGPLCSPLDFLARNLQASSLNVGDLVMVPNVGAYGLSASLTSFLSRRAPAEVAYRGETVVSVHRMKHGYDLL